MFRANTLISYLLPRTYEHTLVTYAISDHYSFFGTVSGAHFY